MIRVMMNIMTMVIILMMMMVINLLEIDKRGEATVRFEGFDSGTGDDT